MSCPSEESALPPFDEGTRVLSLSFFIFGCVFVGLGIAWWISRRNDYLLRKRSFGLMLCSTTGIMMQLVTGALRAWLGFDKFSCDALLVLTFLYIPVTVGPLVVRQIMFVNATRFEQALLRDRSGTDDTFDAGDYVRGTWYEDLAYIVRSVLTCACFRAAADVGDTDDDDDDDRFEPERVQRSSKRAKALSSSTPAISTKAIRSQAGRQRNREQRLRFFLKSSTLAFLAQLVIASVAVASIAVIASRDDGPFFTGKACTGCSIGVSDEQLLLGTALVISAVFAVLLVVLRRVPDPLGIVRELQLVFGAGILAVVGLAITTVDPGDALKEGESNWLLIICAAGLLAFAAQCPYQVWRSARFESSTGRSGSLWKRGSRITLAEVLATSELKRVFQRYLATEFSTESSLFLDVVAKYRLEHAQGSKRSVAVRAVDIYNTFIRDRSMLEVNVSGEVKRALRAVVLPLQEALTGNPGGVISEDLIPPADVFDEAFKEVFELLERDSFPRFLTSPQYREVTMRDKGAVPHDGGRANGGVVPQSF